MEISKYTNEKNGEQQNTYINVPNGISIDPLYN